MSKEQVEQAVALADDWKQEQEQNQDKNSEKAGK